MALRSSALIASRLVGCRDRLLLQHRRAAASCLMNRHRSPGNMAKTISSNQVSISGKPFSASAEDPTEDIVTSVQGYYDDPNALNFHMQAWGEDIHIGRYDLLNKDELENLDARERIRRATTLSTNILLGKAFPSAGSEPLPSGYTVMDMGSAHGSTARAAAKEYGCNVVCIDVSRGFNTANAKLSADAGLSDKIIIPGDRSFFETQMPSESMDAVLSQDAFSHASTEHHRAIEEAARVLKPGGLMAFTDLMQTGDADPAKLAEVYQQVGITRLATPGAFVEWGMEYGLELIEFDEKGANLGRHYEHLVEVIESLKGTFEGVEDKFLDRMTARYGSWCAASKFDVVTWGAIVFRKK
ncbi:unnamed protein product [Scytosiphon promiscuus]